MNSGQVLTNIKGFQEELLTWYISEKEAYPWRLTKDPWAILVSEIMLQQTQVATVLNKGFYVNFLKQFPDVQAISKAPEQEILKAWEGLGYYRRVRNLQKTAQAVVLEYNGVFPREYEKIIQLPGVGPYTAGAVCSFAFDLPVELVDANVARVFSRIFNYQELIDTGKASKQLWSWAKELLNRESPADYNSALMELGQKICKNGNPSCMLCPVKAFCSTEEPENLPKKKPRKSVVKLSEHCVWLVKDGKLLLQQQNDGGRRAGMWALPLSVNQNLAEIDKIYQAGYAITHHKVDLQIFKQPYYLLTDQDQWFELDQLDETPIASPFRKAINSLLKTT